MASWELEVDEKVIESKKEVLISFLNSKNVPFDSIDFIPRKKRVMFISSWKSCGRFKVNRGGLSINVFVFNDNECISYILENSLPEAVDSVSEWWFKPRFDKVLDEYTYNRIEDFPKFFNIKYVLKIPNNKDIVFETIGNYTVICYFQDINLLKEGSL